MSHLKVARRLLDHEVQQRFPFLEVATPSEDLSRFLLFSKGAKHYTWQPRANVQLFINFIPDAKLVSYSFDLGWHDTSETGTIEFPEFWAIPNVAPTHSRDERATNPGVVAFYQIADLMGARVPLQSRGLSWFPHVTPRDHDGMMPPTAHYEHLPDPDSDEYKSMALAIVRASVDSLEEIGVPYLTQLFQD